MRSNIVTQLSKNEKTKSRGPFPVLSLLYTHLGRMARAFHKKIAMQNRISAHFAANRPKTGKLYKEKSYFLCSFFFIF